MPNVPTPASGLGSNSNYLLCDNCNNLPGVTVTIDVQQDMVASAGFGFQLNAYSPFHEICAVQQYCILVDGGGAMACVVNNWNGAPSPIVNDWVPIYQLPTAALPAGYQLRIELVNDAAGDVYLASFTVNAIAPTPGTALSSFQDSYGEHVFCIGKNGHLHQLISVQPNWRDQDLSALARGQQVANGSAITSFVDSYGEHVCYIGTDGHVHKLMTAAGTWIDSDLTAIAGGRQVADGSALTSYVPGPDGPEHVCYIGTDAHVHKLMTAAGTWIDSDLSAIAGGHQAANGTALTSFVDEFGEHVCYIGADGQVHKLMTAAGTWIDNNLTQLAGGTPVMHGSALTSFVDGFGEHIFYIGTDGHVHQLIAAGGWFHQDLTTWAHGSLVSGTALTGFVDGYGEHVCYVGIDNHVHKLMTVTDRWIDSDLTAIASTGLARPPQVAQRSALTSFVDIARSGGNVETYGEHVSYIGTDGYVHQLFTFGDSPWSDQNLTCRTVLQLAWNILGTKQISPIVAFELDIVGFANGQSTTFSSGSGTITYAAARGSMTVVNLEPPCCEFDGGTLETANTSYGELPDGPSAAFVQTFSISAATIKAPKRNPLRKTRPAGVDSGNRFSSRS